MAAIEGVWPRARRRRGRTRRGAVDVAVQRAVVVPTGAGTGATVPGTDAPRAHHGGGQDFAVVQRGHRPPPRRPRARRRPEIEGFAFRTLPRPPGELLATFATVNDVHFGEDECGLIDGSTSGPRSGRAGRGPVPRGDEPRRRGRDRGHRSRRRGRQGRPHLERDAEEYDAFLRVLRPPSATGSTCVRGNHESYHGQPSPPSRSRRSTLPGVTLAVIDTSVDGSAGGRSRPTSSSGSTSSAAPCRPAGPGVRPPPPVGPGSHETADRNFGIDLDDSERAGRRGRPPPVDRAATSPATPTATACGASPHRRRALGRGGVRQGLPRRLGRVPGPRGRDHPDRPPHLAPRGARLDGEDPAHVPRALPRLRVRPARRPLLRHRRAMTHRIRHGRPHLRRRRHAGRLPRGRHWWRSLVGAIDDHQWDRRARRVDGPGAGRPRRAATFKTVVEYVDGDVKDPHRSPPRPRTSASCWPSRRRTSTSPTGPARRRRERGRLGRPSTPWAAAELVVAMAQTSPATGLAVGRDDRSPVPCRRRVRRQLGRPTSTEACRPPDARRPPVAPVGGRRPVDRRRAPAPLARRRRHDDLGCCRPGPLSGDEAGDRRADPTAPTARCTTCG